MPLRETIGLILVGALWGCTNPLIREGSSKASSNDSGNQGANSERSIWQSLKKFRNYQVWLPYALNQSGSLVYYFTLATSDLSLAVPICNALALVFSIITSYGLGEKIENPVRTIVGSGLVVLGVAVCMISRPSDGE